MDFQYTPQELDMMLSNTKPNEYKWYLCNFDRSKNKWSCEQSTREFNNDSIKSELVAVVPLRFDVTLTPSRAYIRMKKE